MIQPTPIILKEKFMPVFDNSFTVESVSLVKTGVYKLTSCVPGYAYVGGMVSGLKVVEVGENYCNVESSSAPVAGSFTLARPSFLHGTQKAINSEIINVKKGNPSFPLIYLQELQQDQDISDPLSSIGRNSPVLLWFLLRADKKALVTSDKYSLYVNPMTRLSEIFKQQVQFNKWFGRIVDSSPITYHTIAGKNDENGFLKDLFGEALAGVSIKLTLPVKRGACQC